MSLYLITWVFTLVLLASFSRYAIQVLVATFKEDSVPLIQRYSAFLLMWVIYLVAISSTGILNDFTLPPKLPLIVVIPALLAVVFFITRPTTSTILEHTPMYLLVGFQGFRVFVELIIWLGFQEGYLPVATTFEGSNFDIIVGLTAIPIAFYTFKNKTSNQMLLFWNIAGLLILANTVRVFVFAGFFPELLGLKPGQVGVEFVTIPYLFIASIYMPMAVFLHGLSIRKILQN